MKKENYFSILGIKIPVKYISYVVYSIIPIIIIWYIITVFWGYQEIGKFGEKRNYTTQYWVYLQPESAGAKNYRVIADIKRQIPNYYLLKVYWPNGGHSDFEDCNFIENDGEFNRFIEPLCIPEGENNAYHIKIDEKVK